MKETILDTITVTGVTKTASKDIPNLAERSYIWLSDHGPIILFVIVLAILIYKIASLVIHHAVSLLNRNPFLSAEQAKLRIQTIGSVITAIVRYFILFVAGITVLNIVYQPAVGAVLASASILGVALGFGAQTLVRDFISGFFILFEDQYSVGDIVQIGTSKGTVERLSFRTTSLRDFEGRIHTIANSEIKTVINESRGWSRAIVDIGIRSTQNAKTIIEIIEHMLSELVLPDELTQTMIEKPRVTGIENFTEQAVVIRIIATVKSGDQDNLARIIRAAVQSKLQEQNIDISMTTFQ
ncbi:MAG: mechanosensitive ion channel [Rubrobacteridae bacterium]|nr:mechanosensitive ion channel [Rubrobacteridae bacterium]